MTVPYQPSGDRVERAADVDLADPAFWRLPRPERLGAFALLRELDAPVLFTPRPGTARTAGKPFYALVRHADVRTASRTPGVFASAPGVTTPEPAGWAKALFGNSMVNMDGPEHAALRRIISRRFTPRLLAGVEENVGRLAGRLVDELIAERPRDFVPSAASRLPLEVICDLMGIPQAYRARISEQIDQASEHVGVERRGRARIRIPGRGLASLARMQWGMGRLAAERRRRPGDDLVSALVCADIDGEALSGRQLGAFFSLLLVAGVETTRNAIAHGLFLLDRNPEQRELLRSDFDRYTAGPSTRSCGIRLRSSSSAERSPKNAHWAVAHSSRARKSHSFTPPPIAMRRFSPIRIASTSPARPIPIWDTAAGARTTAWARIWPASK